MDQASHGNAPSHLTVAELKSLGFSAVGEDVCVSRKVSFYNCAGKIGNHVRIDDYVVITGQITLGNYVHIAPFCLIIGTGGNIIMEDGSGLSSHCALYTSSDDYKKNVLSNPTVPDHFKNVTNGPITFGRCAILGSHSVVLPNVKIGEGASLGAQSLIYKDVAQGCICVSGARKMEITGLRDVEVLIAQLNNLNKPSPPS